MMTTLVQARRPGTEGKLLRLGGLQWVGWGMDNKPGRGAAARDQEQTSAGQGQARGGLGDDRCLGPSAAARDQGPTLVPQRLAEER